MLAKKTWAALPKPENISRELVSIESVGAEPADKKLSQNQASELSGGEINIDTYEEFYTISA